MSSTEAPAFASTLAKSNDPALAWIFRLCDLSQSLAEASTELPPDVRFIVADLVRHVSQYTELGDMSQDDVGWKAIVALENEVAANPNVFDPADDFVSFAHPYHPENLYASAFVLDIERSRMTVQNHFGVQEDEPPI